MRQWLKSVTAILAGLALVSVVAKACSESKEEELTCPAWMLARVNDARQAAAERVAIEAESARIEGARAVLDVLPDRVAACLMARRVCEEALR